ncbi:hypothetical protein BDV18DRAFT_155418 [Aspergillus unguis]
MANMLQLYNIDFVVLEAYPSIAPQVGASIGILPHGNRIMDQIGVYDKILSLCPPLDSLHFRKDTGEVIHEFWGMNQSMHERHGYPIVFLDRQMVLQVLYDNIKDKSKVLTKKRVQTVDMDDNGVTVTTSDSSSYQGDILIGADGIHSTVREEMWRIANNISPGWIAPEMPCDYGCIFGISNPCHGIVPGSSNSVFKKHQSYIVNGGPEGRVYWFYFFKLAKRAYGKDIPIYTKEDEQRILAQQANDNITPTLKFQEMLDKKVSTALVPLQEYIFRQWYFKRIITIGDSAHKFHPISGHGGNACIESAAALVNNLRTTLARAGSMKPSLGQIEHVFDTTQRIRRARTVTLKEHSHEQQRTELLDTWLHELIAFHILPRTDAEDVTLKFSRNIPLAEKLDSPKLRPEPRLVPYKDELLSTPRSRGAKKWYFITFYLLIAGLVYYGMWMRPASYGLGDHIGAVISTGKFSYDPSFPLQRIYTGIKPLDDYLVFLAVIFLPGLKNWDTDFTLLQIYFLGMLIQPIAVWTAEAFRKRNTLTPISFIGIWLTLVQSTGIGIYMPMYYAVYTIISEPDTYWWPLNREVLYAGSMNWAVHFGYTLPTILMFTPWKSPFAVQGCEALWQVSPMLVAPLCMFFGRYFSHTQKSVQRSRRATEAFPDIFPLKKLYVVTGTLGVLLHGYCIASILTSPSATLASVFWPDFSMEEKTLSEGMRAIFLADFWGFHVATYGWLCMAVWDLKRVGRTSADVGKAAALIALGCLAIGPGATMSAVWHWRETRLAKTSFTAAFG